MRWWRRVWQFHLNKKHGMKWERFYVVPYHTIAAMVPIILQRTAHWKVETPDKISAMQWVIYTAIVQETSQGKTLLLEPHIKVVLPTIAVQINGIKNLTLLDTSCLWPLISWPLCHSWKRKEMDMLTVGVGLLQLDVSNRHPISIEVLVVNEKLLGFDLLLGFEAIKKLPGVYMNNFHIIID